MVKDYQPIIVACIIAIAMILCAFIIRNGLLYFGLYTWRVPVLYN